jgi:hypothetical protein
MQSFIHDPFAVKRLEKLLKRKLTTAELEGEAPVRIRKADGTLHVEWVRKIDLKSLYGNK